MSGMEQVENSEKMSGLRVGVRGWCVVWRESTKPVNVDEMFYGIVDRWEPAVNLASMTTDDGDFLQFDKDDLNYVCLA